MLSGRPTLHGRQVFRHTHTTADQRTYLNRSIAAERSRDLETICMKCLEKSPEKRYASAADAIADLQRFVNGEPIQARPITKAERAWRWAKRKPVVAGLSAVAATLGAILMIGGPRSLSSLMGKSRTSSKQKHSLTTNAQKAILARDEADANALVATKAKR